MLLEYCAGGLNANKFIRRKENGPIWLAHRHFFRTSSQMFDKLILELVSIWSGAMQFLHCYFIYIIPHIWRTGFFMQCEEFVDKMVKVKCFDTKIQQSRTIRIVLSNLFSSCSWNVQLKMLMYLKNVWNEYLEIMIMDSMGRDRELSTFKADFFQKCTENSGQLVDFNTFRSIENSFNILPLPLPMPLGSYYRHFNWLSLIAYYRPKPISLALRLAFVKN